MLKTLSLLAAITIIPIAASAAPAQPPKIGFLSSFSGPYGSLGEELYHGFELGMKGLPAGGPSVIRADDQAQPGMARQIADKMINEDHVDLIVGPISSAVVLALVKPVTSEGKILVSLLGGPTQLAGKNCNDNFYVLSGNNDSKSEALGRYLHNKGVKRAYLMAPNYPTGHDKLGGFKRFFHGQIVGEVYTPFNLLDFAPELARVRIAKPDVLFVFYPGDLGVNFLKQFHQAGLSGKIPLYGDPFDEITAAAAGDASLGAMTAAYWTQDKDNPANRKFVADYVAAYKHKPSLYAALGYDGAQAIGAVLRQDGDTLHDRAEFRRLFLAADFPSVRGEKIRFARNHFALNTLNLAEVAKGSDGRPTIHMLPQVIAHEQEDDTAKQCHLPEN